jgi:hypothetical protein
MRPYEAKPHHRRGGGSVGCAALNVDTLISRRTDLRNRLSTTATISARGAVGAHGNVLRGEKMTKANELNPLDFEADAREPQAVADSPEVQAPRIITLEDLHQHVLDLAADLKIKWSDWRAEANPETGTVYFHPIKSENAYAMALHEIGHIRTGRFDDVLIEERRAWEWARDNALVWTPTMQREADSCIGAYETDEADIGKYYYDEILAFVNVLLGGNDDGELVYDALVANAVELAQIYERYNAKEVRLVLVRLIDKYLAGYPQDAGAAFERAMQALAAEHGVVASQSLAAEQQEMAGSQGHADGV